MDNPALVATDSRNDVKRPNGYSPRTRQSNNAKQKRRTPSTSQKTKSRYLSDIREKYRGRGFSSRATELIIRSWRKSTLTQYVTYIKLWYSFAGQGLQPTLRNIIEFLVHLHTQGYSHDQICSARSAVGVISDIQDIGKHPDMKRLMKGMFEKAPQLPKYTTVWDVTLLFNYFREIPHQNVLPLELLSKKLAIMIGILAGGQRSQTIHTIKMITEQVSYHLVFDLYYLKV